MATEHSISKNQVTVSTSHYERAGRKSPRGRGQWAFSIGQAIKFFWGSYSDAKKQAIEYAAQNGVTTIYVEY